MKVICPEDADANLYKAVQQSLNKLGYYNQRISGVWDLATQHALYQFQEDNELGKGELTIETLDWLDVEYDPD